MRGFIFWECDIIYVLGVRDYFYECFFYEGLLFGRASLMRGFSSTVCLLSRSRSFIDRSIAAER